MNIDLNDPAIKELLANPAIQAIVQAAVQAAVQPQPAPAPAMMVPVAPNSVRAQTLPPQVADITLAQFTLLNNGKFGPKEKYATEFKMCLELWTAPDHAISLSDPQWKRNVNLIGSSVFGRRIKKLLHEGTITQEYFDTLYEMWKGMDSLTTWFGLIGDKGSFEPGATKKGTNYYDGAFLVVPMVKGVPSELAVSIGGEPMHVERFATTLSNGRALSGKYTHQARLDLCDYGSNWRTQ